MQDIKTNTENQISPEEIVNKLKEKFKLEREEWLNKIKDMAAKMRNVDGLIETQVDLLSNRQIVVDYIHNLLSLISNINRKYKVRKRDIFKKYNEDYDLKLQKGEKDIMVDGDLADIKERVEILSNQIKYYEQTLGTIDHFLYSIKERVKLEEFRRK